MDANNNRHQYDLKLSHKHLRVLQMSLELFSRIAMGQYAHIYEDMMELDAETREKSRLLTDELKKTILGLDPGSYFSICSPRLDESVHIAYEIEKTVQKMIAEVEKHHRYSVWHDGPLKLSPEPLPQLRKIENDESV